MKPPLTNLSKMLQLILIFFSLIAASAASCNRMCGKTTVPYPFGFSPSCSIKLSCNSTSGISFSGFPIQNFAANNTFLLSISANCTRPVTSVSAFFSTNYALTHRNGLFLRECAPSATSPCTLQTMVVSQELNQTSGCKSKEDNLTCFYSTTGTYLTKDSLNKTSCGSGNFFTSSLYEPDVAGQPVLDLGIVEIGWWMTGNCRCVANARCTRVGSEVKDGYWCKCHEGFVGDGFADGDGCRRDISICNFWRSSCGHRRFGTIIGGAGLGLLFILVMSSFFSCWGLQKRKRVKMRSQLFKQNGGYLLQQRIASHGIDSQTKIFTEKELEKATENYSENNVLGQGGYGTVYKGTLSNQTVVAIKKSKKEDENQIEQFINEIIILSQINHRNVVKLLGCCLETQVPLLVYEFISNGTLSHLIHGQNSGYHLAWDCRLRISAEVAGALAYLHSAVSFPIIHRDIKSSNILLDKNFTAKVSDFGASRSVPFDKTHVTTLVQGTIGYLDPEYFLTSKLTEKSDVYSFGVVLVELLTGDKPISFARPEEFHNLVMYFTVAFDEGRLLQVIDPQIANEVGAEELQAIARLTGQCLNTKGEERPAMKEVALELEALRRMRNQQSQRGNEEIQQLLVVGNLSSSDIVECTKQYSLEDHMLSSMDLPR